MSAGRNGLMLPGVHGVTWSCVSLEQLSLLAKKCTQPQECICQVSIVPKLINCLVTILTSSIFMSTAVVAVIGAYLLLVIAT